MKLIRFPGPYKHTHPPLRNANEILEESKTTGQRAADWITSRLGSWKFIITQSIILLLWVLLNVTMWINHWDPYPFILMNLVLSLQAAYAAPVIMMSQNRAAERDRLEARIDYSVNQKAEEEIRIIMEHLEAQDQALTHIYELLIRQYPEAAGKEITDS
jgi:uncharacterized membrane protein